MNTYNSTTSADTSPQVGKAYEAAEAYREKGYARPIPMRKEDAKRPFLKGVHGRKTTFTEANATAHQWWEDNPQDDVNLALVMAADSADYEIISIDVDHHDNKRGRDHLEELEGDYGSLSLDQHPARSTRRGVSDKGGQYFFRVPKEQWWPAQACTDVDIRSLGISYATVWPSVKDGERYQWLDPDGEAVEPPAVWDLPTLPKQWVECLSRGTVPKGLNGVAEPVQGLEDAYERLHGLVANFDAPISETLVEKVEKIDLTSAHPEMNGGVHSLIQWCAFEEGPSGLRAALERLESRYLKATRDRRRQDVARGEFARSVEGEVDLVLAEVAQGKSLSITKMNAIAHQIKDFDLTSALGASRLASAREELMEGVTEIIMTTTGDDLPAEILLLLNDDLRAVELDLHDKREPDLYDTAKGVFISKSTLRPYYRRYVAPALKEFLAMLDTEDDEQKWLAKRVGMAVTYCGNQGSMNGAFPTLAGLLMERHPVLRESDFDAADNLRGLSDGMVIDINKWIDGDLKSSVRPRRPEELLKKSMNISGAEILKGCARLDNGEVPPIQKLEQAVFHSSVIPTVNELMAYSLHGNNPHRVIWGAMGDTGTGKSTWLDFYQRVLGDYGATSSLEDLSSRQSGNNSSKAAAMRASVAFLSELSQETRGQRDALKEISGNTEIAVTDKFTRTEYHKGTVICFSTNEPARIDFDEALEDRFVVVPTAGTRPKVEAVLSKFSEREGDNGNWQADSFNAVGLLNLMARNFARPWKEGFKRKDLPDIVVSTAERFVMESNPVNAFLDQALLFRTGILKHRGDKREALE
ncbi:bifunctional DNA primase/polymerase [Corynebacterium gallinarum]|uniref:Bifunctional DNA primase/polymerase n=1 Tax=Corynebacterium gallinarum TaxID=2762214 RepID=A0A8I0HQ87_9CORY|nr:bifunctional DNA primase/polymerase [Corynebacterium gallinarum]MBD8030278.1 bifunctional DNA primase/polymerase [Corynebacterium gallinarum]